MKYDEEQVRKAIAMRESGISCRVIGAEVGMTEQSVEYHCMLLGAETPTNRKNGRKPRPIKPYERNGRQVRPFSKAEDQQLIAMRIAGEKWGTMAEKLQRPRSSIRNRLLLLSLHQD